MTTDDRQPEVTALLERARARLDRLTPERAHEMARQGALLVDTRPAHQRDADGAVPDALVIERNHLEWRLDPTSPWRVPQIEGPDQLVIVLCDEGYASSLAAASLRDVGLSRATDVVGGFQAWRASGLPVIPSTAATFGTRA